MEEFCKLWLHELIVLKYSSSPLFLFIKCSFPAFRVFEYFMHGSAFFKLSFKLFFLGFGFFEFSAWFV